MNVYLAVIIASLLGSWLLGALSKLLNVKAQASQPPIEFADTIDSETYAKSRSYTRASMQFSVVADTINTALTIGVILAGGFNWLDIIVRSLGLGSVPTGLAYIGSLSLISGIVGLPFEVYHTFVLEKRFGFNTTTIGTFISDRIKSFILSMVIGGVMIAAILFFLQKTGPNAWLLCWGFAVVFTLGLTYVAPTWILPLFNKFTPLEDGELRQTLEAYAHDTGFELSGIFVVDGSKRSTKSNAFFTGFGKRKRIALFDTLINNQTTEEIVSVLAHEVGHSKRGHIKKRLIAGILKTGIIFYLMNIFLDSPGLFAAFGMEHMSIYAGLIFFILLYTPVSLVLSVASNLMSRKHEFEADLYASETTGKPEAMISALKKLSVNNLSDLTPHPLTVWLEYGHPPVLERIRMISTISK
jgi:STE24 endopeptidase